MPLSELSEGTENDIKYFLESFTGFHQAYPNENQHIVRHVINQVKDFDTIDVDYLQGAGGQEPIWKLERKDLQVYKRIFHPGRGEHVSGADFVLYKKNPETGHCGITAIQVKRNGRKKYFLFAKRDLDQLKKFSDAKWKSAYYLLIDETPTPPLNCFLTIPELKKLLRKSSTKVTKKISNTDVRRYCRGGNLFYESFYACTRGSVKSIKEYVDLAVKYVNITKRAVVELFIPSIY